MRLNKKPVVFKYLIPVNPVPKKNEFLSSPTKKFQKHTPPWQVFLTPTPTAPWP